MHIPSEWAAPAAVALSIVDRVLLARRKRNTTALVLEALGAAVAALRTEFRAHAQDDVRRLSRLETHAGLAPPPGMNGAHEPEPEGDA